MHLAVVTCTADIQLWKATPALTLPALPPWRLLTGYLHASCAASLFRDPTVDLSFKVRRNERSGAVQAESENKKFLPHVRQPLSRKQDFQA